jgi:hypothetical protein
MLKSLATVGVLFLGCNFAQPQVVGNGSKQNQPTQASQTQGQSLPIPQVPNRPAKQEQAPQPKPYQWRELYAPANIPNWVLAIVAGWAGIMALKTLWAVKKQGDLMTRQADAMEKQNKAMRDRERARITIVFPPDVPDFLHQSRFTLVDETEVWMEMVVSLHNDGLSKAFNVRAWAGMVIQYAVEPFVPEGKKGLSIPEVIRDATLENPVNIVVSQILSDSDVSRVENQSAFLFLYGEISYDDVFGDQHRTPFRYLWNVDGFYEEGQWQDISSWENQSPTST